jgi:hypothetical protein
MYIRVNHARVCQESVDSDYYGAAIALRGS